MRRSIKLGATLGLTISLRDMGSFEHNNGLLAPDTGVHGPHAVIVQHHHKQVTKDGEISGGIEFCSSNREEHEHDTLRQNLDSPINDCATVAWRPLKGRVWAVGEQK